VPTFPATLPLAGTAFVAMLQLTLIGEGWPLAPGPSPRRRTPDARGRVDRGARRLPDPGRSGSASGLRGRARPGPVPGADLGAALVLIGAWQMLCCAAWRGWPFVTITNRAVRLSSAHLTVLGGGIVTYLVARRLLGLDAPRIAALAGCFIAAGLVFGMLLEG
jgi:hypothetical protein